MKKLSPAKRKRVEYFAITTSVFFSTAIVIGLIFGAINNMAASMAESAETTVYSFPSAAVVCAVGLLYGLIISMMIGAIMLFARFMSDKPLWLKITAAVLWPITYMCIAFVLYATIPYWVYNTVKMFMREKESEVIWSAENYSSLAEQSNAQPQQAIEQPTDESASAIEATPEVEDAAKTEE